MQHPYFLINLHFWDQIPPQEEHRVNGMLESFLKLLYQQIAAHLA